jgi:hypothetical protein
MILWVRCKNGASAALLLAKVLFAMLKHGKNYKQPAIPVQFGDDTESPSQ